MVYDYYRTNFVTARTALFDTVKIAGFSAPRIMPPGSNIEYFVETVVSGPGKTWQVMKFDVRRSLLSFFHCLLRLYNTYCSCFWKEVVKESFADVSPSLTAPIRAVPKGYSAYFISSQKLLQDQKGVKLSDAINLIKDTFSKPQHVALPQHVSTIVSYTAERSDTSMAGSVSFIRRARKFLGALFINDNLAGPDYKNSFNGPTYRDQGIKDDLEKIDKQLQKILKDTANFIYWSYKLGISIVSVYEALGKLVNSWQELATMISHLLRNGEVINLVIPAAKAYVHIQSGSWTQLAEPISSALQKEAVAVLLKLASRKHTNIFKTGNFLEQPIVKGDSDPNSFIGERICSDNYVRIIKDIIASTLASESDLTHNMLQKMVMYKTMGVEKSPDLLVQFDSDSFFQGYPVYCLKNTIIWNDDSRLSDDTSPSLLKLTSALKDYSKQLN